jgi:replicative DNA helicase
VSDTTDFIIEEIVDEIEIFERQTARPLPQRNLKQAVAEALDYYEAIRSGAKTGVYTGLRALDELTGGLKAGNFCVIAGPTGSHKTSLALNIARHVAMTELVLFYSLEMSRQELINLLVAMVLNVDRNHFNDGAFTTEEMDKIAFRREEVERLKLSIFRGASVEDIRTDCVSLSCEEPVGLIIVDYLQLMSIKNWKGNREQEISTISHALKAVAMEHECPLIVLSQLNEEGYLRESRAIAHDADLILLIKEGLDTLEIRIDKSRTTRRGSFTLNLIDEYCRIEN